MPSIVSTTRGVQHCSISPWEHLWEAKNGCCCQWSLGPSAQLLIQKSCVVSWAEMENSDHWGVKGYTMPQHATCLTHLLNSSHVSIFILGRLTFLLGDQFLLLLLSNETIHRDHALAVVQHSQAEFQSPDDLSEF